MEAIFLKIEIITSILSFFYIIYYSFEKFYFTRLKPRLGKLLLSKIVVEEKARETVKITGKEDSYKINSSHKKLTKEQKDKLEEIINRVRVNFSKGYLDTSKSLIIEGLSIDKNNVDLNFELAKIYEKEKKYKNAEYIYFDLIESESNNFEILKNLGFVLALQKDFKKSIDIFEKALMKKPHNVEILEMLTDINFEIGEFKQALKYTKLYLREKPKDFNKMLIEGICYENTGKIMDAIVAYKNMLEMQPYNTEVIERLKNLES